MTSQNTEAKSRPKRSIFGWLRRDPDARREAALEKAARKAEKRLRKEEKANRNKADEARLNTVREEAEKAREALRAQEEARRGKQRVLQRDLSGEAEPESDEGMLGAFRRGVSKTRETLSGGLTRLVLGKKEIDRQLLDDLEELLITADVGPETAERLLAAVREKVRRKELGDPDALRNTLREEVLRVMQRDFAESNLSGRKPAVLLFVGVNGTGKTTSIGKIAAKHAAEGKRVLLAAGDTFRAAAVEQLGEWAERAGCDIVSRGEGADPSSVIYQAVEKGVQEGYDLVLCDTAGRLHTKKNLMEELRKVRRVIAKLVPDAPHETWLVLDANTGQNAIFQARDFLAAVEVTGLVVTKLDGTARGGVVIGIMNEFNLPIRYIGVGERVADLRPFDPDLFVQSLFD